VTARNDDCVDKVASIVHRVTGQADAKHRGCTLFSRVRLELRTSKSFEQAWDWSDNFAADVSGEGVN